MFNFSLENLFVFIVQREIFFNYLTTTIKYCYNKTENELINILVNNILNFKIYLIIDKSL